MLDETRVRVIFGECVVYSKFREDMRKLFLLPLAALLASCSMTHVVSSWQTPDYPLESLDKVIVLAVMPEADVQVREAIENQMVLDLAQCGVRAESAYVMWGPGAYTSGEDIDALYSLASEHGAKYTSAIIVRLIDTRKEITLPSSNTISTDKTTTTTTHKNADGSVTQHTSTQTTVEAAQPSVAVIYTFRVDQYEMNGKRMIYYVQTSSRTSSMIPLNPKEISDQFVADMVAKGILVKPAKR